MKAFILAALAVLGVGGALRADERLFGYVYEAEVLPKGALEIEQMVTNRNGKAEGVYSAWDLSTEIETGLTDALTSALYFKMKSLYSSVHDPVSDTDVDSEEFHFEGLASEWKWRLASPHERWLGAVAYLELAYNGPEFEAEAKLILQHNFGDDLVWAMNFMAENEYAYTASSQSVMGISEFSTGLAYKITPAFSLGLEARNQRHWPGNWSTQADSAWSAGPAFHLACDKWWATFTVLPQLSGTPETISGDGRELVEHERVETRLVAGLDF